MKMGERLDQEEADFFETVKSACSRMQNLIDDLLRFSELAKEENCEFETLNLVGPVKLVLQNLDSAIKESDAVVTYDNLPVIRGRTSLLIQLLQNLIGNALKFRNGMAPRIHIDSTNEGDYAVIRVRDNGIGFDPQFAGKIFNVFGRLHSREDYPGTGLGLATCKRIIEILGGSIWAESTPNQGSVFSFKLLRATQEPYSDKKNP
jgi:light-regulated signal transduction histidine kinase (bacteriophytochrome)